MRLKKLTSLLLLCFVFHSTTKAQKRDSVLITQFTDLGGIGWFNQFTFIHEKPMNKVDVWVKNFPPFSNFDTIQLKKKIDELGAIKSKESYALLYLICCQPIVIIEHITAFNSIVPALKKLNAYQVLNKYYLNNAVSTKLPKKDFDIAVAVLCSKHPPICYYYIIQ